MINAEKKLIATAAINDLVLDILLFNSPRTQVRLFVSPGIALLAAAAALVREANHLKEKADFLQVLTKSYNASRLA